MNNNTEHKSNYYLLPLALALCICGGIWLGKSLGNSNDDYAAQTETSNSSKIRDILQILDTKYVDDVNGEKVFETAIGDMLHQLDPHSNYIPATELQAINESINGEFFGIGIRFFMIRDTLCVTNVINNSPSMIAGLLSGDKIIAVDGKSIGGKMDQTEEIMSKLKGPDGTKVKVTILRGRSKMDKTITRGAIPLESIPVSFMLSANIGYVKIDQFSMTTTSEFKTATTKLLSQGMKKIVLDLRDNGGGLLGAAVNVCDEFLEDGLTIVKIKGEHLKQEVYKSSSRGALKKTEVVVLINSNSASASEILAGALQDNDRATIMGRRSFGKGLVQEDFRLRDGSNLRLTIARYYTPTGRCIQKPYNGNIQDYYKDQINRIDNGELFSADTTLYVDSLKFKTPKGKTVYGGGGIMPDVFVAYDSIGNSGYYTQLRYAAAFQMFAFDYVLGKRNSWKNPSDFNKSFNVSDALFENFVKYAADNLNIEPDGNSKSKSKLLIKQTIKSEIARQIWIEAGFYEVEKSTDKVIQKAIEYLRK